ncbi:MAG: hypothetical protein Q7S26_04265, partial [bacterium]|nr:hypothetical protein [bacterium]
MGLFSIEKPTSTGLFARPLPLLAKQNQVANKPLLEPILSPFLSANLGMGRSTPMTTEPSTLLKDLGQGIARTYVAGAQALTTGKVGVGKKGLEIDYGKPFVQEQGTTFGYLTENLLGTSSPVSLAGEDKAILGEDWGKKTGGALSGVLLTADFFTGGAGSKLLKPFAQFAAKATKVGDIAIEAQRVFKGIPAEEALSLGERFAKISDAKVIEDTLIGLTKQPRSYIPLAQRVAPKTASLQDVPPTAKQAPRT